MIGVIPCSKAFNTFLFTVASVSAKYSLLSECPMITYFTPTSVNMLGAISPVYAPLSSKYIFSAPMLIFVPLAASIAGTMLIAGTQNTTSTSSFCTNGFNSLIKATASLGVLFIFQLPAIIFFLMLMSPLYLMSLSY